MRFLVMLLLITSIMKPLNINTSSRLTFLSWPLKLQFIESANNPLIISGISSGSEEILVCCFNITTALKSSGSDVMLSMVLPECNSMGLSLFPEHHLRISYQAENNEIDALWFLRMIFSEEPQSNQSMNYLTKRGQIIVLDSLVNKTTEKADILLGSCNICRIRGYYCKQ